MLKKATIKKKKPTINAEDASLKPCANKKLKSKVINGTVPLTKLGMVLAAVERTLVPNCSAAIVTKMAQ